MFKAAKAGPQKAITANRLDDGRVVFLDEDGGWTHALGAALLVADGPDLDEATAYALRQQEARIVVEPYAIDIAAVDGRPTPSRIRERIRAEGPTILYGQAEYDALHPSRSAAAE